MPLFETFSRTKLGLAAIGLLAVGGVAGGAVGHAFRPPIEMAPTHAVAIRTLPTSQGVVTIKGRVAESFGSRIVIDDGSGRTLIDGGPRGGGEALAAPGAIVSVQGRYDDGAFHPSFLVDASGTVTPFGPPHGPGVGPHGHPGPGGGCEADRAAPPPPGPVASPQG
jgi:hypothetical protein